MRKNMFLISRDDGCLQQKVNISYQYSPFRIKTNTDGNKYRLWFIGLEMGRNRLQNRVITYFTQGSFYMYAEGVHIGFLATKVISKQLKRKNKFSNTSTTFKVSFNHFNTVKSYPSYDTYVEEYNFFPPEKKWITDDKTKSVDFEIHFTELLKINSYNFLKLTLYTGIRVGNTSGNEHKIAYKYYPNTTIGTPYEIVEKYRYPINPIILGLSLGYQINLGRKPVIK